MTHNATSGVAHFAVDDDRECLALIRELLVVHAVEQLDDPPPVRATDDPIRIARIRRWTRWCRRRRRSPTTCTT